MVKPMMKPTRKVQLRVRRTAGTVREYGMGSERTVTRSGYCGHTSISSWPREPAWKPTIRRKYGSSKCRTHPVTRRPLHREPTLQYRYGNTVLTRGAERPPASH